MITYDLTSSEPVAISLVTFATGQLSTHGTIKVKGPDDAFSIMGTASGTSNIGAVTGHYKFKQATP